MLCSSLSHLVRLSQIISEPVTRQLPYLTSEAEITLEYTVGFVPTNIGLWCEMEFVSRPRFPAVGNKERRPSVSSPPEQIR